MTAVSDPLPQIIEGIPLRTRSIRVDLDRPNFALNPTNCDGFSVRARIAGSEGAIATPAAHFQVANCGTLPFSPKLALQFSGGARRAKDPALHATLNAGPGEANIAPCRRRSPALGVSRQRTHQGALHGRCSSQLKTARLGR